MVRMWNSSAANYDATGGLYSQDHAGVDGSLYIFGAFTSSGYEDHWSYGTDFDGEDLTGSERAVSVRLASGTEADWNGDALFVIGTSSASTTIDNQGSGTYSLSIGGTTETEWQNVVIRNTDASGLQFADAPIVNDLSFTDHEIAVNGGTAITVAGSVINANEAKNFTNNTFSQGGASGASNVTANGSSVSSWRFTNHAGDLDGEGHDVDPAGDPGYLVWDDSAALITVSGNVYSDEGSTVSSVCDGSTDNVTLVVAGLTAYSTSCNGTTGAYSISNVAFGPTDTLTLYLDGETAKAANVTVAPISSISNMHLYEGRVIVRHENTDPITIADMAEWDSSDDSDVPFTAVDAGTDTLTLASDLKLIIWTGKTFAPNGNVTLAGGGGGSAYDGTLEALANAKFIAAGTENHSIGGSFIFGLGAAFTPANSTVTFTTTGSNRTIDTNNGAFSSVVFDGDGSWTIADDNFTTLAALSQSDGSVTYGSGTTTIGTSMNVSNGSFVMNNGPLVFTATGPANTVRFNGSAVPTVIFDGTGSWNMTDTDAESDGSVIVRGGTVSLPSGTLSIADSFRKSGGTVIHNTSELIFTTNASSTLYANGSDLSAVTMSGSGTLTMEDINVTLRDSLTINAGTINAATGTLTIGGSLDVAAGTFNTASNTILFNASNVGKTINLGGNTLYNATFGSGSGGWTWQGNATTTNNLTLASAAGFVKESGTSLYVGGVFSNLVGGSATTWTGSDLVLGGSLNYSVNNKNVAGDNYDTMTVISDTDVRIWNSNAASLNISSDSSMYSQDHNATNGLLHIYGDFHIATTSEYWSYATDFDGTTLSGGARRAVIVEHATFATTTLHSGSLAIVGAPGASTTIQSSSGTYHLEVAGGTFNASYYEFHDLDINGLTLTGTPAVTDLSNGYFDIAVNTGSLITLASSSLNANASKIFTNVGFNATDPLTGYNVNLVGETANAWRFADSYGSIGNEGFDIDGLDACGSIRFDDSACLLTEQTHFRWRNDDGGAGVPDAEWFDLDWDYRQRIRVVNEDSEAYASTAIKVAVDYDSGMKADFSDLRFTADDGLTPIPFWLEKYTASTEAVVWVRIPSLPAEETATAFMYYGNGSADSASSGTSTFDAFDDYEDDDLDEYSGNTALFTTDTAPVYGGTYSLEASNKSGRTTGGLYRTDLTTAEGQIIRYMQYIDIGSGAVPGDEACTLFGVQGSGANYGLCLEQFGTDRMVLSRDIDDNDISGSVLSSTNVTYTTGWYEVEIIWQTDDSISAYLYDPSGTLAASTTASDSTYASGGIGYTFWYQNGAWDSYTARALGPVKPTVYLGARTTHGGATWLSAADSAGSAAPGDVRRLRMAVENSGLDITDQEFKLEFAAMGAAPSCEAVANANYAPVPNQTACGSSPVCMQASDHVSDNDPTADLLFDTSGSFTAGRVVESPSAATEALDIDQRYYTELEYVITPTINAVDAYCFRVTDNGDPLDYYATIAELSLEFDPVFGPITLNGGGDIALAPGATTTIYAAGTVTDFNGYADIVAGSSTIYRSGAGASCTPNNNDCYVASTDSTCSFINCSGNTCELSCAADIYFHADPTDIGTYEGEEWLAYMEVSDQSGGYDFASASGVELLTLRALAVDSAINYGSLAVGADTGSTNASTTIENLGNTVFDLEIEGTDLVDGNASMIPAEQQKFATTTFNYAACISCSSLSSDEPVAIDLGLSKPTAPAPPVAAPIYWGISVPLGVNSAPHQGINLFTPISAD